MTQKHGLINSAARERHYHLVPLPAHGRPHIPTLCTSPSPGQVGSKMTLSSLLSHDIPAIPTNYHLPPVPDVDRTHWKGGGGGGWKGGKGNPNAALSALTLLAFLFFLNILQSCLRDSIGNNNGMLVMMLPPNATATRAKRDVDIDKTSRKEDSLAQHQNWTDLDITNLVHTQVESYWSNKGNGIRKHPLKSLQKNVKNNMNKWDLKMTVKDRISTKLVLNKEKKENDGDTLHTSKMTQIKTGSLNSKNKLSDTAVILVETKDKTLNNAVWTKTIRLLINNSIPYIKKIICCSNTLCENEENLLSTNGSSRESLIRKSVSWFCKSVRPVVCNIYSSLC